MGYPHSLHGDRFGFATRELLVSTRFFDVPSAGADYLLTGADNSRLAMILVLTL